MNVKRVDKTWEERPLRLLSVVDELRKRIKMLQSQVVA